MLKNQNAQILATHTGPNIPTLTDEDFSKLITGVLFNEVQYRPGTGILNEIIDSGKLSIINSSALKKALASLDGLMLKIHYQEKEEHGKTRSNLLDLMLSKNTGIRKIVFEAFGELYGVKNSEFLDSNLHLLQSKKFDNSISTFIYSAGFLQDNYYSQLEQQIEAIIKIIDDQLKSR